MANPVEFVDAVRFNDVYPWVWSVMLGVALTLAERRGAFLSQGTHSEQSFWKKNILAITINVVLPVFLFALTMSYVGPVFPQKINFWQILLSLYLAATPLGSHHLWLFIADRYGWTPAEALREAEQETKNMAPYGHAIWLTIALIIPAFVAISCWLINILRISP